MLTPSSPRTRPALRPRSGFAILEVVLAVAIAGAMITGIAIAMQNISRLGFETKREAVISRIIHNELRRAMTTPSIAEGTLPTKLIDEWDIQIATTITPLTELTNRDGIILDRLFEVKVEASWWEDGGYVTRTAQTWRHANLYAR